MLSFRHPGADLIEHRFRVRPGGRYVRARVPSDVRRLLRRRGVLSVKVEAYTFDRANDHRTVTRRLRLYLP